MSENQYTVPLLPFDELLKLHQQGLLDVYAEQKTRELIVKCKATDARSARLETLAFKLSAIRARYPSGLKAYLEIDRLLRNCQFEFQNQLQKTIHEIHSKTRNAKEPQVAKILAFPTHSTTMTPP